MRFRRLKVIERRCLVFRNTASIRKAAQHHELGDGYPRVGNVGERELDEADAAMRVW